MSQYINKVAIVAEIEKEKAYAQTLGDNAINGSMQQFYDGMKESCNSLLNLLDTLEVKEVDLDREIILWANAIPEIQLDDVEKLAKYFFELGYNLNHS